MGGVLHAGAVGSGASFELERLERDDGRLVVSGWWFGVRGIRFVRPALVVDGRRVLAAIEDKPWPLGSDGAWTAAFPWTDDGAFDASTMTLVVAPSVEVPLDASGDGPRRRPSKPQAVVAVPAPEVDEPSPIAATAASVAAAQHAGVASPPPADVAQAPLPVAALDAERPLRDELRAIERQLEDASTQLEQALAAGVVHEARCRELEHVVARERRAAGEAETARDAAESHRDQAVRAQMLAAADHDRMAAQHAEAIADCDAAVRARTRMEVERDQAIAACEAAEARRHEAAAQRDEARMARDEVLVAHQSLQGQLRGERAQTDRLRSAAQDGDEQPQSEPAPRPADGEELPTLRPVRAARTPLRPGDAAFDDGPIGVRMIPAARNIAAHLHRARRVREHGITEFDLWVARILGTVAAVCFILLLLMVLKAFFAF
jgi:hypothetical protein